MAGIVELKTLYEHIDNTTRDATSNRAGHINIFKIDDIHLPPNRKPNYTRRSFYKITLITGENKIHYADQCKNINGTALIFTNPNVPYFWETVSERQTGYMCIFTEPYFNLLGKIKDHPVFQLIDEAVIPLSAHEPEIYTALFSKMYNTLHGNYPFKYDLLGHLLMEVVHEAQKGHLLNGKTYGPNAAQRLKDAFTELLERQFPIELNYQPVNLNTPSAFAGRLHVHVNHLNKVLTTLTGRTTTQWINDRMIQEAKVLLKTTSWTISEIAYSLGYREPNQFSAFFKNKSHINATDFRKAVND
ncbi:MAG: helix-turn-helix transcriptional regulator [Bacteroidota bacterium]|nr:helix-turn-helix transcriptional regulator [Bacteroidota bacterium]